MQHGTMAEGGSEYTRQPFLAIGQFATRSCTCYAKLLVSDESATPRGRGASSMNNLVLIALRRPYTFVVLAILILVFGSLAAMEAPTDVFPVIQIPVSSVVWIYDNLMPADVEGRITYVFERFLTQTVEGIKYIWSNSLFGNAIINIYLQDGVDLGGTEADIAAISQTTVKALPPDINAPMVMRLFPSQVPVATLQVTSSEHTPAE